MGRRYLATCVHCGQPVVAASRFADTEFASLRAHLEAVHPALAIGGTAHILQQFAVRASADGDT